MSGVYECSVSATREGTWGPWSKSILKITRACSHLSQVPQQVALRRPYQWEHQQRERRGNYRSQVPPNTIRNNPKATSHEFLTTGLAPLLRGCRLTLSHKPRVVGR
jgi:hypothetical protein